MREYRLIKEAIEKFELDLFDLTVLTEAASGNFVWTPLIAALSGAKTIAYSCDSKFADFQTVKDLTEFHAHQLQVEDKITILDRLTPDLIGEADIITNTGFLRPLNEDKLQHAKEAVVIPLMWETWEFRSSDLDLSYCFKNEIPVLGTNESDPRLKTMSYLGPVVKKLLFECDIEVCLSKIVILGRGKFAQKIFKSLNNDNAICKLITNHKELNHLEIERFDSIVIADHESDILYIGKEESWFSIEELVERNPSIQIIHISGCVDIKALEESSLKIHPPNIIDQPQKMSVTTDFVGPKPVIDLHSAGLKVGEIMVQATNTHDNFENIKKEALKDSLCQDFSKKQIELYS